MQIVLVRDLLFASRISGAAKALDIELLNQHLQELLAGQTIAKPIYNFKEGRRVGTKPIRSYMALAAGMCEGIVEMSTSV